MLSVPEKRNITFFRYKDNVAQITDPTIGSFIGGRGITIHNGADDLGQGGESCSLTNGCAGPRVGCCTIQVASQWEVESKNYWEYVNQ